MADLPGWNRSVGTPTATVSGVPARPAQAMPGSQPAAPPAPPVPAPVASPPAPQATPKPPEPVLPGGPTPAQQMQIQLRRERQMVARQRQAAADIHAKESALAARETQLSDRVKRLEQEVDQREKARGDPLKWLEYGGHTYDSLANQMLDPSRKPDPLARVEGVAQELEEKLQLQRDQQKAELDALKAEREQENQRAVTARQAEVQATVQRFYASAIDTITQAAETYELTNLFGRQQDVPQLVEQYYQQTLQADQDNATLEGRQPVGILLSVQKAGEMVESYYTDLWEKGASSKKLKDRVKEKAKQDAQAVAPPLMPPAGTTPAAPEAVAPSAAALSNGMAPQATPRPASGEFISEDERMRRAREAWDRVAAARKAGGS